MVQWEIEVRAEGPPSDLTRDVALDFLDLVDPSREPVIRADERSLVAWWTLILGCDDPPSETLESVRHQYRERLRDLGIPQSWSVDVTFSRLSS